MTPRDDIQALLIYLGGANDSGEIEPIGADDRLVAHFGSRHQPLKQACDVILDELMQDDESWKREGLDQIGDGAASRMKSLHPEFSEVVLAKLGNWYAWQWR